jgi:hypothetical protein
MCDGIANSLAKKKKKKTCPADELRNRKCWKVRIEVSGWFGIQNAKKHPKTGIAGTCQTNG